MNRLIFITIALVDHSDNIALAIVTLNKTCWSKHTVKQLYTFGYTAAMQY